MKRRLFRIVLGFLFVFAPTSLAPSDVWIYWTPSRVIPITGPILYAQELVTLTTPETRPSNPAYHVAALVLDVDAGLLAVTLKGVDDVAYPPLTCTYASNTTPTGASLIVGLNKANLSTAYAANATTGSLKQRIFHRLVVMGEAATVCGKPLTGTLAGTVP